MVVSARAQKRYHPPPRVARGVALREVAEKLNCFGFGKSRRQVERAFELKLFGDSTKKIGDGFAAHFAHHRFTLFGRIRNITHRDSGSWEWDCGLRIADCGLIKLSISISRRRLNRLINPQSPIPHPPTPPPPPSPSLL